MLIPRAASFLVILTLVSLSLFSQGHKDLYRLEDSLSSIQRQIQKTDNDSLRASFNNHFRVMLKTAIGLPGSFTYPFDSLKKMAKMTSPDKMFRIYNWNLPSDGANIYFCFLQIPEKSSKKKFRIIELTDRSDSIPDPEHSALGATDWYGALYYKIISEKTGNGMLYTLLGWKGMNQMERQKIIEILSFDEKNLPHFGKKIFNKYKDGGNQRVIFRYSPVASMVLRYDEQFLLKGKKWNPSRRTFDETLSKTSLIICDRLVMIESSEGKGQVLVPEGDEYDGFIFENDRWNFVEGVDARNR